MKKVILGLIVPSLMLLFGCQSETMVLLDEEITEIKLAKPVGVGEISEDVFQTFTDNHLIQVFSEAITTAIKRDRTGNLPKPDVDILVEYKEGLPTHAIHLWLGKKDEQSMFMYIIDDEEHIYLSRKDATKQLRELLK